MVFEPITGLVSVGSRYYAERGGPVYCWEIPRKGKGFSSNDLNKFIDTLRKFNVNSNQIDNTGTEDPIYTEALNEGALERVLKGLERPIIRVLKQYTGKRIDEDKLLEAPYLIEIKDSSFKCKLRDIPAVLNELGCGKDDVLFHEEKAYGEYDNLNKLESGYIISSTLFKDN